MENYIVRVLRRTPGKEDRATHLDGVVELVENGKRLAFHNAEELWSILGEESVSPDELERLAEEGTHQQED